MCKWEKYIEMVLGETICGCVDWFHLAEVRSVACSCEQGKQLSWTIKWDEFLDKPIKKSSQVLFTIKLPIKWVDIAK
jgi:hypothetical protein